MADKYFVYEHVRLDSGRVFYVGKGSGDRHKCKQGRNKWWRSIVEKHGYRIDIRLRDLDEELAHLAEMELIAKHRMLGNQLTNMTDGGEGMSGHKWSAESIQKRISTVKGRPNIKASLALKGVPKSESHRRKLSESRKGMRLSAETKARISASLRGRPSTMLGKKHHSQTIEKLRALNIGNRNKFFAKKHSAQSIEKMSVSHRGAKRSAESIAKQKISISGELNHRFGKPVSDERKLKQAETLRATIAATRVSCPHCAKVADKINAGRWHFDNCRRK